MELGRVYDMLQKQNETMVKQGELLATIHTSQLEMKERLFGTNGNPGAIDHLYAETSRHSSQITFWRGGFAVLAFLWTALTALAAAVIKRH